MLITHLSPNKFEYQNKEKESTFNLRRISFGARTYNASIGRFDGVDPLGDHQNQADKSPYNAFWNSPIKYDDPDEKCPFCPWLDAVVDVGFVVYDAAVLVYEKVTTGKTSNENWAALAADGASIAMPMAVGAGIALKASMKAANKVDNAADVVKTIDKV